jgi:transketolase N-terminal domain/subunit
MPTDRELALKSLHYRRSVLRWIKHAGAGHTGGSLSCVDILNVLYNRILWVSPARFTDPKRDRYIQSKGHSVEALFVVLADRGFFPETDLETLCGYQSDYVGHPTRHVAGVEQNTGALGHGLPIAVGTALASKLDDAGFRAFTLLGDGELAEGSNWEGALAGAHYKLDNLTAIIDCNTLQITGRTKDVMNHNRSPKNGPPSAGPCARSTATISPRSPPLWKNRSSPANRPASSRARPKAEVSALWKTSANGITACRATTSSPAPTPSSTRPSRSST